MPTTPVANGGTGATDVAGAKAALDVDHLITLSGVAAAADDLGTFTGATINDNVTVKAALQALETAQEATQGAIGQRDSKPQNKIVLSMNLYETFEDRRRIGRKYKVWRIKRQLKNISGGKNYRCLKAERRRNPSERK